MPDDTHHPDTDAQYGDSDSTPASATETITIELDEARAVMYRMAAEAVGQDGVDGFIEDQVKEAVQFAYDNREQMQAAQERALNAPAPQSQPQSQDQDQDQDQSQDQDQDAAPRSNSQ